MDEKRLSEIEASIRQGTWTPANLLGLVAEVRQCHKDILRFSAWEGRALAAEARETEMESTVIRMQEAFSRIDEAALAELIKVPFDLTLANRLRAIRGECERATKQSAG